MSRRTKISLSDAFVVQPLRNFIGFIAYTKGVWVIDSVSAPAPVYPKLRVHSTGMHSGSEHKEFFFEDHAVGYFEDQLPSSPGEYRYMPFRGPHLRLVEALASSGSQRCYYMIEGKKQYFIVLKTPSHGVLLVHAHTLDEG
jgi:hypothetical protein